MILSFGFCANSYCQIEWAPIGTEWYYTFGGAFGPPTSYVKLVSEKDTIIEDKNCKFIKSEVFEDDQATYAQELLPQNLIIHQEGNQIFRWVDSNFHLLYNFDLVIGDTIQIYIPELDRKHHPSNEQYVYFYVDSIGTEQIGNAQLTKQLLQPMDRGNTEFNSNFSDWVIEGIGNRSYFVPVANINCDNACPWPLRCYSDAAGIDYNRFDIPCDTVVYRSTRVHTLDLQPAVQVFPNPVVDAFKIISDQNFSEVSIIDSMGRSLFHTKASKHETEISINASFLDTGVYFVRLVFGSKIVIKKFFKQ